MNPVFEFMNHIYTHLGYHDVALAYESTLVNSAEIKFGLSHMQFGQWYNAHTMLTNAAQRYARNGVAFIYCKEVSSRLE